MTTRPRFLAALLIVLAVTATHAQERDSRSADFADILQPLRAVTGAEATLAKVECDLLADAREGKFTRLCLAEAILVAEGEENPRVRKLCLDKVAQLERQARQAVAKGKTNLEKGELLLRFLHATAMKKGGYQKNQSALGVLLEHGTFNCLSSTGLYVVLARRLGLDARAVEVPEHIFAVLYIDDQAVDVETTNERGFNPKGKRPAKRREVGEVGLVGAAFANRISHMLQSKREGEALRAGLCGLVVDPESPMIRKNTAAVLVNWSGALIKNGKHEQGMRVASEGMRVFPKEGAMRQNVQAGLSALVKQKMQGSDHEGALEALKRHGEQAGDAFVKRVRAAVYGGWCNALVKEENWPEAARVLKLARAEFPNDRGFRETLKQVEEELRCAGH